jgi:hypothetical protein
MTVPTFEFKANSALPADRSGVAVWRYEDGRGVECIVRQHFDTFDAAFGINELVKAAWDIGEAVGFGRCETRVLDALRGKT